MRPLLLLLALALPLHAAPAPRPPNIVLIFCDDMGYADVGCYGAKGYKTPNIDRLAKQGVRFTDFYVPQGVCSASRAALLTGCYPNRLGILGALGPGAKIGLNPNELTIAKMLKARGYATAIITVRAQISDAYGSSPPLPSPGPARDAYRGRRNPINEYRNGDQGHESNYAKKEVVGCAHDDA